MNWIIGGLLVALVLYGILAFVCRFVYRESSYGKHAWRNTIVTAVIGVALINVVAWVDTSDTPKPGISQADMAGAFGLVQGTYMASTLGIAYGNTGFTVHGFADTKDGRVLNVDFTNGTKTYPLSIPADKVVIEQVPASAPQLTIWLSTDSVSRYGTKELANNAPCRVRFAGILTCHRDLSFRTVVRGNVLLSRVVHDGVTRVTLRLSPTMYALLGGSAG
jgi:hypothetical protein